MKKLGLIKRIGLTATVFFVCLAMLITCFTFGMPRAARAAVGDTEVTPTTVKVENIVTNTAVKDSYNYGDNIAVPEGATVTAPNGKTVEVKDGFVKATQLGVYKISYTKNDVTYDFKVSVALKENYFLYIEYNGADIPTYVENNESGKFTLPEARVMYYDKNNVLTELKNEAGEKDYTVEIEDSQGNEYKDGSMTFDPSGKDGKVFITYTATLGLNGGTKRLSKTFTVNIQSKVNKNGNPSLAVSGITRDASVNRPVTLPVARVSDNNDDNVKVVIEVYMPDGKTLVPNVEINDDGYAVAVKENDPVIFDNDKSMTFYPTETGKYKVRYTAYNDFYDENNPTAGGKSGTTETTIEVGDHVAPVFKNVDKYEYLIPETWGMTVTDENGDTSDMSGKIKFLIPEVVDNKCHVPADEKDTDNLISLYFRITDADNSTEILKINNILSYDEKDNTFTANDTYKKNASFKDGSFTFDLGEYEKKDSKDEPASTKAGTYTVLFRARDKDNNTSSKTYTITVKDSYEDKAKPSAAEVTAPDYLSAADESFTVPYAVYADSEDIRPLVQYKLYNSKGESIDVKGGEVASLTKEAGYLVINEDSTESYAKLELGDKLYFYVGVTDKAGNFRSNAVADDKSYIDVVANEVDGKANVADLEKIAAATTIIKADAEKNFSYADSIKFLNAAKGSTDSTPIFAGDTVNAGSFVITAAEENMRNYTGFEVAVYDPQGNYVDLTLETASDVKGGVAKIYVQNIRFTATVPTEEADGEEKAKPYTMTVRVFDVNGNNKVNAYTLMGVNPSKLPNGSTSAITNIGPSGNVNVKYKLNNEVIKQIADIGTFRVVRKISGGIFSLMGSEFTAKTAGSYSVQDGYINANKITDGSGFDYDDVKFNSANKGNYDINVIDDEKPVIELQGKMPTYEKKDATVEVPTAVAYTKNGMGEITIDVKDPDGKPVKLSDDNTFKAEKDGVYTVTYTGTYENGTQDSVPYSINVGDVFAPKFTVTGGTSTASSKKEGDTFTFKTMVLDGGESSTGVNITKQIYDPSHELISASTVDGSFSGYADKKNNGSEIKLNKVGEYTIVYTARDSVGNEYKITETLTVTSKGSSTPTTWTTLSTVLIVVAIVLLAGVIIYVVRFRKVKK